MSGLQRRGFSISELLIAMLIFGIVCCLSLLNLKGVSGKANARALAHVIADQMRLARQEAISNQEPVALCFPSEGKTKPHSQGFYLARGLERPRITRVVDCSGEHPGAVAFVGTWPETTGTATIDPTLPGTKSGRLDLTNWLSATMKEDYCFVFTPEGGVVTNSLPFHDGAYHMLVSAGAVYVGGNAPGGTPPVTPQPAYFQPTALGETYTVAVSPSGAVQVLTGVANAAIDPVVGPSVVSAVPPAALPALAGPNASQPVIASLEVFPKLDPSVLPPGVDVMVPPDGHVTMLVTANDPQGQQLYLQWTANAGNFSFPGEEKMQWDPVRKAWLSYWQWRPPDTAVPGQQFTLRCSVRNMVGQVAVPAGPSSWNVEISPPGVICFQRPATTTTTGGWSGGYDIMVMNPDGGECRAVIQWNSFVPAPSVSRDGTKITWCEVGANGKTDGIWVANIDGTDARNVYTQSYAILPVFSPLGDRLAFVRIGNNSQFHISVINSNGSGAVTDVDVLAVGGYGWDRSSWSPDGTQLVYQKQQNSGFTGIFTRRVDLSTAPVQLTASGGDPSWSPDPSNPYIIYNDLGRMQRVDTSGIPNPFPQTINGGDGAYSPDGSEIVFSRSELFRMDALGTGGLKQITTQTGRYPSWGP